MKKVTFEIMNAYDTRVRHAISDDPNTKVQVSYAEYEELKKKKKELEAAINKLRIEQNVWDQAREICMNIADEMLD